jgi:hypothetical protein
MLEIRRPVGAVGLCSSYSSGLRPGLHSVAPLGLMFGRMLWVFVFQSQRYGGSMVAGCVVDA